MKNSSFHTHIRKAIANPALQAALDANAERRVQARKTAFSSLEEPFDVLRQRAHNMRAETIAQLDRYLEQFITNAQANGISIHRAANADEAVQIVFDIAQKSSPKRDEQKTSQREYRELANSANKRNKLFASFVYSRHSRSKISAREEKIRTQLHSTADSILIAKSKTMVSEEIELNAALEAAGIQVIETDLGEYIVQLRGEKPAHIITPAVHLRREEVGETFHEKLGIPQTTDIPTLTDAARSALRQTFLNADIGLSGVNFGVAESGALCIVTNEGNGRMVTTLPPVHIALMGMERLVPTFDDLALMLSLLPRSATGQKISVYTQIIHAPRAANESDGPLQRHLIILDNGRASLRGTSLNDILLCIRCGACLNACPIFREIGGHAYVGTHGQHTPYPGPIGSVISPGLFGAANFGHLAQASTLCGACKEACPVDIDLPGMLLKVRSGDGEQGSGIGLPWSVRLGLKAFTWAAVSPGRFGLAQKLAAIVGRILSPGEEQIKLPAFTGWGYSKDMARPAGSAFRERFDSTNQRISESAIRQVDTSTIPPAIDSLNHHTVESPAQQFARELTALSGDFIPCTTDTLADEILTLLRARNIDEIMAWEAQHLPEGLLDSLRAAGIRIGQADQPHIQAGLSGALGAAANTGTLALASGAGRPQGVSLLPQIHIVILQTSTIKKNLRELLRLPEIRKATSTALISGPSRTADIEMTLTIGVHGPGELHVLAIR